MQGRQYARVRDEMGISLPKVAKWAHVSRSTVSLFEANPAAVGEAKREGLERVYRELMHALERLRPARA